MSNKNNKKEEIIEELEELALKCEVQKQLRKEKMFFKHMFFVYFGSKIQIIVSFLFSLISFIIYQINSTFIHMIYQMIIVFISSLVINLLVSLFRCYKNKEIQKYYRIISLKLFLQIFFLLIFFLGFLFFI